MHVDFNACRWQELISKATLMTVNSDVFMLTYKLRILGIPYVVQICQVIVNIEWSIIIHLYTLLYPTFLPLFFLSLLSPSFPRSFLSSSPSSVPTLPILLPSLRSGQWTAIFISLILFVSFFLFPEIYITLITTSMHPRKREL